MRHDEPESTAFVMELPTSYPKARKKKREAICTYHARIQRALAEIECCMQREDPDAGKDAVAALRRAQDAVEVAFPAGQAMEDRLREFRNAIEHLGFVRKKPRK